MGHGLQTFDTLSNVKLEIYTPGLSTSSDLHNMVQNRDGALGSWWWTNPITTCQIQPWLQGTQPTPTKTGFKLVRQTTSIFYMFSGYMPVNPGEYLQGNYDWITRSSNLTLSVYWYFYDASYNLTTLTAWSSSALTTPTTGIQAPVTQVPAGVAFVRMIFLVGLTTGATAAIGDYVVITNVNAYRTATSTSLGAASSPPAYTNVMSYAGSVDIKRAVLDASTLTAVLGGSDMDPATNPLLSNGAPVRCTAYDSNSGTWEPLFTGFISDATATYSYDPNNPTTRKVRTTLTASDAAMVLANTPTTLGTTSVDMMPQILANGTTSMPFPWMASGWAGTSFNEPTVPASGSLMDQLILARDTGSVVGGVPEFAWVDRNGVLQTRNEPPMASPSVFSLNGGSYDTNTTTTITVPDASTGIVNLSMKATAAGTMSTYQYFYDIVPGEPYTVSMLASSSTARTVTLTVDWLGIDVSTPVSTVTVATGAELSSGSPTTFTGDLVAPANAYALKYTISVAGVAANEVHTVQQAYVKHQAFTLSDSKIRLPVSRWSDVYSSIDVSYSTSSLINQVIVTDGTNNYGPYANQASVDKYGPSSATYTVQQLNYISATNAATFAASVLASNSTPQRLVHTLTFPVLSDWARTHAIRTDLCHTVWVEYSYVINESLHRVTGIEHNISTQSGSGDWLTTYTFDPASVAQSPTVSASGQATAIHGSAWVNCTLSSSFAAYDAVGTGYASPQYTVKDGLVTLQGLVKATVATATNTVMITGLPVPDPAEQQIFIVMGGANVACRMDLTSAGNLQITAPALTAGQYVSLSGIQYYTAS